MQIKIGIILPTNNPDAARRCFDSILDGCLNGIKKQSILLINFQHPWSDGAAVGMAARLESAGWKVKMAFNKYTNPSAPKVREDCAKLYRASKYYLLIDDDMIFSKGTSQYPHSSGERYAQVAKYMDKFHKCGVVMCEGSLGGSIQKTTICPSRVGLIATCRGLFLRNLKEDTLFPVESFSLREFAYEETIVSYRILSKGYFFAKQFNNPTIHHPSPQTRPGEQFIRDAYDDPRWRHDRAKLPPSIMSVQKKFSIDEHRMDF